MIEEGIGTQGKRGEAGKGWYSITGTRKYVRVQQQEGMLKGEACHIKLQFLHKICLVKNRPISTGMTQYCLNLGVWHKEGMFKHVADWGGYKCSERRGEAGKGRYNICIHSSSAIAG